MKKNYLQLAFLLISVFSFAQVGINIDTPTEKLDVNGTLRVRSLPNDGAPNAIYTTGTNTNSGTNPTQTFVAGRPAVVDANGVIGKTTYGELVPNSSTTTNFNSTNTSSSMFVVRRYHIVDNLGTPITRDASGNITSGILGRYHPDRTSQPSDGVFNGDTGMDVNNWQAVVSNVSFKMITTASAPSDQFRQNDYFNYRLKGAANGTWKIVGDIINIQEEAYIDILFIKASVVAAENRAN